MAANESVLADADGTFSDWIEIHNTGGGPVSMAGYHLTDDRGALAKWTFPAVTLEPDGYLVVFASGKNRVDPAGELHTSFGLSAEGEYLALVAPDSTVLSEFAPGFPPHSEDESFGMSGSAAAPVWSYFALPTPGAPNGAGTRAGPVIEPLEKHPLQPAVQPLVIAARVQAINDPVTTVTLLCRRMFTAETSLAMRDDGTGGDAAAGDGVWTATLPALAFGAGEMTRWRFEAADSWGTKTQEPAFKNPRDSHQYFGTVTQDERVKTALPMLQWFTSNASGARTATGSRGCVYYEGELYDNVLFTLHGQSTASFLKASYNIDFNRTQRFLWNTNAPRVADIDLLTNWADKSKVRHVLAYEVMRKADVAGHFACTVRIQQNGAFHSTADLVEDADEIYLERAGLNPDGALYKIYQNDLNKDAGDTSTRGVEKKTRRFEGNDDLQGLINGLDQTGAALERYLYDNIDIPACVNLLAVNSVIRNVDMHSKNWYAYRDTGRSGEWAMLPWDLDLTFGRIWNAENTYFDNGLFTEGIIISSTSIRLVAHLRDNRDTRAMILRRIRTLTDQFLQPLPAPGTSESERFFERRLNEMSALIDPPGIVPSDAQLDFQKWGSWLHGRGTVVSYTNPDPAVETMAEAIQRFKTEYLPGRRRYIYNSQIVGRGGEIPLPQSNSGPATNYTPLVVKGAMAKVLVPSNGNLGLTWTGSPLDEPFNTSGWMTGPTGVGYERATGYESLIGINVDTQMKNNNSVFVRIEFDVADPAAFDGLEFRIKADDGFVAFLNGIRLASSYAPTSPLWNSAATLSHEANPATFSVFDVSASKGRLQAGRNILAIQGLNDTVTSSDMIIVPELYGTRILPSAGGEPLIAFGSIEAHPASGNEDEEYVELVNRNAIAVDISNWRLTGGVEHTFAGGTVLAPNQAIYICPSSAAFRARQQSPKGGEGRLVQGGCQGHLSSSGESLVLLDAAGVTNNSVTYSGEPLDVQRYLVVSELMYHPNGDGLAEFIELLNISKTATLNLQGVRFTEGIEFDFTGSAVTSLPPGGRLLIVRELAAFRAKYGTDPLVAGVFANGTALSNSGERLTILDPDDEVIWDLSYDDQAPWPLEADQGHSLVLIAPETRPELALAKHWRASIRSGGNPGGPDEAGFAGDPVGDKDGNGEADLIDYAMGNDLGFPPIPVRCALQPDPLGGPATLQISFPASLTARDAELGVFFSPDLVTWQEGAAHLQLVSRQPLGDGRELVTWSVQPPLRDSPQVFVRLGVLER